MSFQNERDLREKKHIFSWKLLFFLPILFFWGYSFAFPVQKFMIILVFFIEK